ncbi:MAG: helix-turn-helix domain-containing protein [Solimonas sp.]
MSDIAGLLKSEITRLSKKVVKQHSTSLQKASTSHRRQIAALKKQIEDLQREVSSLRKGLAKATPAVSADAASPKTRFVAKGLKSLRTRLGLSARELGLLVGVSEQAVYNWESKTATPRANALTAIAELRGIGKKEARARLEQIAAQS